jgi:hypothetical protein
MKRCAALTLLLLLSGCVHYVTERCPTCRVLDPRHDADEQAKLPGLRSTTKRLFVLVPGALGWGWEWDPAVTRLKSAPDTEFVVFWWEPYGTIRGAARELARYVNDVTAPLGPRALTEVVIVAHSVAGIIATYAAPQLLPTAGVRTSIATIGTPFAGMSGWGEVDVTDSIGLFSIYAPWSRYPTPPDGVELIEYRTTWPEDPVMKPRFGHEPAPPDVGPQPRRLVQLPHMDHNKCVELVVERLLERAD